MGQAARDHLFFILFLGSYVAVYQIVLRNIARHIRDQNSLLDRCRSLYMRAEQHLNTGERAEATKLLARIRRIERVWKIGDSYWLRWAVMLEGIAIAVAIAACMRSFPLPGLIDRIPPLQRFAENLFSFASFMFVVPPLLHAILAASLGNWDELDLVKDSGDRLEQILRAGKAVTTSAARSGHQRTAIDGLSHRQVLGIGSKFTKAQLKSARNRMARQFHPDLWVSASAADRAASNEAMKRVNEAYNALSAAP